MRHAVGASWITADPGARVRAVRLTKAPPRSLAPAERTRLVAVMERLSARDQAVVALMVYSGLKVAEVAALRLRDLTLGEDGQVLVRQGKDDRDRAVPANAALRAALEAWLAVRSQTADDHVILGQHGHAMSSSGPQRILCAVGQRAQIADLTPHRLRHTFTRDFLRAGVDIAVVSQLLGHANLATTLTYVQASPEDLRAAVERLARGN